MNNIKIKENYVPKAKRIAQVLKNPNSNAKLPYNLPLIAKDGRSKCPMCGRNIPNSSMEQHIRIELLDPKWKEQKDREMQKKRESNLLMNGEDVANSLKNFAGYRRDIFGGDELEVKKRIQEESLNAAKKAELAFDGRRDTNQRTRFASSDYGTYAAHAAAHAKAPTNINDFGDPANKKARMD